MTFENTDEEKSPLVLKELDNNNYNKYEFIIGLINFLLVIGIFVSAITLVFYKKLNTKS